MILVAYDVRDDKRRDRLYRHLLSHGFPVQLSVFECEIPHGSLVGLVESVRAIVDEGEDSVRFYSVCGSCRLKTVVIPSSADADRRKSVHIV